MRALARGGRSFVFVSQSGQKLVVQHDRHAGAREGTARPDHIDYEPAKQSTRQVPVTSLNGTQSNIHTKQSEGHFHHDEEHEEVSEVVPSAADGLGDEAELGLEMQEVQQLQNHQAQHHRAYYAERFEDAAVVLR